MAPFKIPQLHLMFTDYTYSSYFQTYSKPKTALFWDVGGMDDEVPVFLWNGTCLPEYTVPHFKRQ